MSIGHAQSEYEYAEGSPVFYKRPHAKSRLIHVFHFKMEIHRYILMMSMIGHFTDDENNFRRFSNPLAASNGWT